ncbi:MAG: OmpA family protein [Polyangiaceae bacterium]
MRTSCLSLVALLSVAAPRAALAMDGPAGGPAAAPPPATPAPAGAPPAAAPAAVAPSAATPAPAAGAPASAGASVSVGGDAASASGAAAGSAPAGGLSAGTPESDVEREWADRDRKLGETLNLDGSTGLLHTQHAQSGAPGQFRLQFMTEYFSAGFLCSAAYPCKNPRGAGLLLEDQNDHIGGRLALGVTVTKWLEVFANTSAYANSNSANRPGLLQVLGDSAIGAKAFGQLGKVMFVGGGLDFWLLNGTGAVGPLGDATTVRFNALATADLRGLDKSVPFRASLNLSYALDNSAAVIEPTEQLRKSQVTRIERFGLRVNRVDHFDIRLGAETFLLDSRIRPFLEYGIDIPINRQGYACNPLNPSSDKCMATDAIAPSRMTLGGRFLPWKKGFSLTAAFDVGVTGVSDFIEEMSPQAPWTLFLGAGWAMDTQDRPPTVVEKLVEKPVAAPKPRTKIQGFIHDTQGEGGKPGPAVANAIVGWANHPELTNLAAGADGHFVTQELEPGDYVFSIRAEGYKLGDCTGKIPAPAQGAAPVESVSVDCALEALPRVGTIVGHVHDEKNDPVSNASVTVKTANGKELKATTDGSGTFKVSDVAPGAAQIMLEADGFLAATESTDVKARQDNALNISMHHRPKNALVTVGKEEILIKQQVQFETNSAQILPASTALLEEIADAFIKTPRVRRVEVQGHTDNTGSADKNKALSEDRAGAVRSWLIAHGVAGDRLVAKGYGDTKPMVPNVTAGNRAKNRRVKFVILEQDGAGGGEPPPKPTRAKKK